MVGAWGVLLPLERGMQGWSTLEEAARCVRDWQGFAGLTFTWQGRTSSWLCGQIWCPGCETSELHMVGGKRQLTRSAQPCHAHWDRKTRPGTPPRGGDPVPNTQLRPHTLAAVRGPDSPCTPTASPEQCSNSAPVLWGSTELASGRCRAALWVALSWSRRGRSHWSWGKRLPPSPSAAVRAACG